MRWAGGPYLLFAICYLLFCSVAYTPRDPKRHRRTQCRSEQGEAPASAPARDRSRRELPEALLAGCHRRRERIVPGKLENHGDVPCPPPLPPSATPPAPCR